MLDELTATAEYLLATGKFYPIVEEMKPNIGKPDIVYYYGKPSMWEWDENSPKPFAQGLLDLATKRNTLILPSLNQPLGSKAALALVFDSKYQSFFINKLGLDEYNKLRQLVSPTTIIWSENDIRQLLLTITFPLIVKPSNQGSCDGVTLVNNSADFLQLGTRLGNTPEPWVVQEYQEERPLPSLIGLKSNRGSRKSEIVRLDFPFSRTVLFSAKAQCAGGFVTYNTKPIIDDGGLNVPIRIINK